MKPDILLEQFYPHAPSHVWRALTDEKALADWLMPTEGFAPVVGTRFRFRTKPVPGWNGVVDCEVLVVEEPHRIAYSWKGNDDALDTVVTWVLEPRGEGTLLRLEQHGFKGLGGFMLKLMLGRGWKKMLSRALPEVLALVNDDGYRAPPGGTAHGRKVALVKA